VAVAAAGRTVAVAAVTGKDDLSNFQTQGAERNTLSLFFLDIKLSIRDWQPVISTEPDHGIIVSSGAKKSAFLP
jgi:hypothetical protein